MKSANRTYKLQTSDVQSEVTEVLRAEHTDTFKKLSGELPSWLLSVVTVKEKPYDNPVDQTNTRRICLLYITETDVSVTSSAQKQTKCLSVWDKLMLFPLRCGFSGGGFPYKQTSASFNAVQQISVNADICCPPHV